MGRKMLGQKDEYRGGWRKMEGERSSIHEAFCFLPYMFCQCLLILAETQEGAAVPFASRGSIL
jgi:hypothetical protein